MVLPAFEFSDWCNAENSDAFTYIGCHYIDLVAVHHRIETGRSLRLFEASSLAQRQAGYL